MQNVCKFNPSRASDLICTGFVRETKGGQALPHRAAEHALHLVIDGKGILTRNGRTYEITRGDLFFVCEGQEFSIVSTESLDYCYVTFLGRRADELIHRFSIHEDNALFDGYAEMIPFWIESQEFATEETIDLLCESVLLYSFGHLRTAKRERVDVLSSMLTFTQEHFTEPALSISSLADHLGYSPKYLSTLFKQRKGVSYTQYLRELRIRRAIFLMEQGVASVKNVALLSGFLDALYFSRIFASSVGISPKAYIQRLQGEEKPS